MTPPDAQTPTTQPEAEQQADSDALIGAYLTHVRVVKRLAARTVALYADDLHKLAQAAKAARTTVAAASHNDIRRWTATMHASGRSPRGIALILSGWRGFYTWLGREGVIDTNPAQGVRTPKVPKPLPKALNVDDSVALAQYREAPGNTPPNERWAQARDASMTELLYSSGLRIGELTGLDLRASNTALGWVDMASAEVRVTGKGTKVRTIPVGAPALEALTQWLAVRNARFKPETQDSGALFINPQGGRLSPQHIRLRLKARAQASGLATPVHPHMLRHSFASHVLQSSGDLRAVQELLGHANISTTQVYTRLDFAHLAKVYDAAHPRAKRPD